MQETYQPLDRTVRELTQKEIGQIIIDEYLSLKDEMKPVLNNDWQEDSPCASTDPEAFFPEKPNQSKAAKRVCLSCDARLKCLNWALSTNQQHGVLGGLTTVERNQLKKKIAILDGVPTAANTAENGAAAA